MQDGLKMLIPIESIETDEYKPFTASDAMKLANSVPIQGDPESSEHVLAIDHKIISRATQGYYHLVYHFNKFSLDKCKRILEFYTNLGYFVSFEEGDSYIFIQWS